MVRDGSANGPMAYASTVTLLCSIRPWESAIGTIILSMQECLLVLWSHACLRMGAKVLEDRGSTQSHAHEAKHSEDLAVGARLDRHWIIQQSLCLLLHHLRLHCLKKPSGFA